MKVLLVDDHAILREGLRMIIEASGSTRCAQAGTAEEALKYLEQGIPVDVVLLDINLPGMSGLDALVEIQARHPGLAVLMLSMHPEEQLALRSLRMGAKGYLSKRAAPEEILQAVEALARGERYLSARFAGHLAAGLLTENRPLHETLSNREFEIMRMIGLGRTVSEIGEILSISVKTVSTHRERILRKMAFAGNSDIMRYVIQQGLDA